ncbi:MAG: prepilin-type N-terminal cleavage/methylation domain-containing protein [Thermodesulfobacteriota bacterium]
MRTGSGESGFSLVEILIAMTILSIGLLGMAALTVGIIQGNEQSQEVTTASTLAADRLEDAARQGYTGLPTTNTVQTENYGSIAGFPNYKRETTITVDSPIVNVKTLVVRVFWNNNARSVSMNTMITR